MKIDERVQNVLLAGVGSILFGIGIYIFAQAKDQGGMMGGLGYGLIGVAFLFTGSLLLAVPFTRLVSVPFGSLFFPDERFKRPQPLYSLAESQVRRMRYAEAMETYAKIAEEYPEEVKPWIDMIDIAIVHFQNTEQANLIFQQGIAWLEDPDAQDTLSRMYNGIRSRISEKKDWQKTRTLTLDASPEESEPAPPAQRKRRSLDLGHDE